MMIRFERGCFLLVQRSNLFLDEYLPNMKVITMISFIEDHKHKILAEHYLIFCATIIDPLLSFTLLQL